MDSPTDSVETVVPCKNFDAAMRLFLDTLGFRLDAIFPADAPRVALVSRAGHRVRLVANEQDSSPRLRIASADADRLHRELVDLAPDLAGSIDWVPADDALHIPPLQESLVVTKGGVDAQWGAGRAGMEYRDLIPGRLGGRFIASHIRIPKGGPVPDYVHHHHVRFQMIYCYRGWVRLVYEDQGDPFIMRAGDCVLQPPHIRHRVLECSDGFEVVEVGCPADHETRVDHDMPLPTPDLNRTRDFSGQAFVFHEAKKTAWAAARSDGFEYRDTGIAAATGGEVSALVLRPGSNAVSDVQRHNAEFLFRFVLAGAVRLSAVDRDRESLQAGDAVALPSGADYQWHEPSEDLELLEIRVPAAA